MPGSKPALPRSISLLFRALVSHATRRQCRRCHMWAKAGCQCQSSRAEPPGSASKQPGTPACMTAVIAAATYVIATGRSTAPASSASSALTGNVTRANKAPEREAGDAEPDDAGSLQPVTPALRDCKPTRKNVREVRADHVVFTGGPCAGVHPHARHELRTASTLDRRTSVAPEN